jgi:hypothetical protein
VTRGYHGFNDESNKKKKKGQRWQQLPTSAAQCPCDQVKAKDSAGSNYQQVQHNVHAIK